MNTQNVNVNTAAQERSERYGKKTALKNGGLSDDQVYDLFCHVCHACGGRAIGTNITLFPKILDGGERMMLNMFLNISSLVTLRESGKGANRIETPEVDSRSVPQRVWLKPGQTVIISGLEQNVDNASKQGIGSPDNLLTGGHRSGTTTRQSFVITVTPYIG